MTANGENIMGVITWNEKIKQWEYDDGDWCIDGKKKRVCDKCGKPCIDINGVEDADFCLQGLTNCEFISNACCGHGEDSNAYISLKDGRRFVLDKMDW